MAAEHYKLTVNFDDNIEKVEFTGQMVVTVTDANKGQEIDVTLGGVGYETDVNVTCKNGYKLKSAILSGGWQTDIAEPLTNPFKVYPVGNGQGTITLASEAESSSAVKSVSNKNLTKFKQKCDETYAKIGERGGGMTGYTVTVEQDSLAGIPSPSIVFEKADGTTQTVTSSASATTVNNVVKIWAEIGMAGNLFGVSGGINLLTTLIGYSNRQLHVYSVSSDGEIKGGGGGL